MLPTKINTTRTVGMSLQKGVTQARMWRWGPFEAQIVELPYGKVWSLAVWFGSYGFCLSFNRHDGDKSE